MSRKPRTPQDNGPAGTDQPTRTTETGRRFSGNEELLQIERELVANGVDLQNRAIPMEYHTMNRKYEAQEIGEIIELEAEKDHPNKNLIGYLNELQ